MKTRFFTNLLRRAQPAAVCGHVIEKRLEPITVGGETRTFRHPKKPLYCAECIKEMVISCAICREPIWLGDLITLCVLPRDDHIPAHAVILDASERSLVACARTTCCDSASLYCGVWVPAGKQRDGRWIGGVQPFESPIAQVIRTGVAVAVNDTNDLYSTLAPVVHIPDRMARVAT